MSPRLASLLDELDIGLVTVDPATDVANLNRTAASLLALPAGDTTVTAFARALRTLANRALNRTQAVATIATMERDGAAELNTTWVFSESPTHLGVVSKPAPFPGFGGRIWAFTDNSPLAQAVDASKQVSIGQHRGTHAAGSHRSADRAQPTLPDGSQGGHFFTMWYGVYQRSSRTLRYAGAGHPPALVFSPGMAVTELRSDAPPIGIQHQTGFPTHSRVLPPSAEVVIYSDGAFDLDLSGGAQWSLPQFVDLCTGAVQSADWTLEKLLTELQGLSASGLFNDDCTLVRLTIA